MADCPFLVTYLEEEEEELLKKKYYPLSDGAVRLSSEGWLLPTTYIKLADQIYNFEVKPTDTFITGFPKSGNTWTQEIMWTLLYNPDLNNPQANIVMEEKSPFLEAEMFLGISGGKTFKKVPLEHRSSSNWFSVLRTNSFSPRLLKSHLPLCLLPKKILDSCKVVYVARDFRDVMVSYFNFCKLFDFFHFAGTLEEFLDDFLTNRIRYGPYWEHLKCSWEKRDHPNLCFIFYEDLKKDIVNEIKRLDKFLETNRSEEQIQNVINYTSFTAMKARRQKAPPKDNFAEQVTQAEGFFRKGEVGDWKNTFTSEQVEKINAWMAKNLTGFGKNFPYKVE